MGKKHRRPVAADPVLSDPVPDVLPLPPVAEAATDVPLVEPEIVAAPEILPTLEIVTEADALPAVIQPITRADRISAGKLIARNLSIAPAAAQEQAARLSDDQVRDVLAVQLAEDCRERVRQILAA